MKLVNETLYDFERGVDPKSALGIGRVGKIQNFFRDLGISDDDYDITPDNVIFKYGLDLENNKKVVWLPDGLEISGPLNLEGTQIKELPKRLYVSSSLYIGSTAISELPDDLFVGESLYLEKTKITKLQSNFNNLFIDGHLSVADTKITELPDNLKIDGYLDLKGTKIKELPKNLHIGGNLYLSGSKLAELPSDIYIGNAIYIKKNQIKLRDFIENNTRYTHKLFYKY